MPGPWHGGGPLEFISEQTVLCANIKPRLIPPLFLYPSAALENSQLRSKMNSGRDMLLREDWLSPGNQEVNLIGKSVGKNTRRSLDSAPTNLKFWTQVTTTKLYNAIRTISNYFTLLQKSWKKSKDHSLNHRGCMVIN